MNFDLLLDSALAAIDAANPKTLSVQARERLILCFHLNTYVAGLSTRKNGVTYLLLTSHWNGTRWEGAMDNLDHIVFCCDWLGFEFMSGKVGFRVGRVPPHRQEIREVFPESSVPSCVVLESTMLWIRPSAPEGMDNAIERFFREDAPSVSSMVNQATGETKTLALARFTTAKDAVVSDKDT